MGSEVSEFARFGGETIRADAGNAGPGALNGLEYRGSGAARGFPRAELECGCRAEAGDSRRTGHREARRSRAKTYFGAARDRADSGEAAEGRRVAIFGCATPRVPAFANQSHPTRARRRGDGQRRAGGAIAHAVEGIEPAE